MSANQRVLGEIAGEKITEIALTSSTGVEIFILTYGALIRDWRVPVAGGKRSVVLGHDDVTPYPLSPYFGAICGRVGNRIGGARFTLDGTEHTLVANEGANQLHGGPGGMARLVWTITEAGASYVTLAIDSASGDMGYPGALKTTVTYRLDGNRLEIDFEAQASARTPVNIVQHNYFNLMGQGDVLDHTLEVAGGAHVELDGEQIPTGAILPVGGELDFRQPRTLRGPDGEGQNIDNCIVLDTGRDPQAPVAALAAPDGSLTLKLFTDQPGLQLYNAFKLAETAPGLGGVPYGKFGGMCLEDQNFPDAINHAHFPDSVVTPDRPYRHRCAIEIA